jgi:DNA adenine methylase
MLAIFTDSLARTDNLIMKLNPPLSWHGGKSRFASNIIALFPDHQTYCEPFGGSGAVLLAKEPSRVEIFNDLDDSLVNLFRVLRDPDLCNQLQKACQSTLYSRSEFNLAQEPVDKPVERARRFLVRQRMSRSGMGERWSYSVEDSRKGMASVARRWQAVDERLPGLHERLRTVQIEQADWREIVDRYDSPGTLFYLDPPYLQDTRIGGRYPHEMTRGDHDELVQRILRVKGKVVLSGYQHPSYRPLESCGWIRRSYDVPAYSSDARSRRVEQLWLSPTVLGREPTAADRMRSGAYRTHLTRVKTAEAALMAAIGRLRLQEERVAISAVASMVGMSREHVSRRYQHLFTP